MPSTYSSNLKLELPGVGEQAGIWGSTVNTNLGVALEQAVVGRATVTFATDSDQTLTLTNNNAAQDARAFVLNAIGTISTTRNVVVPTINKPYLVQNNTTGGQSIVVKTIAGTGVTVPNGREVFVYADGTNVVSAIDHLPVLTLGTDLAVADGGTGASDATTARTNLGAQATLVSGTNIKTVGGQSLLGTGDISVGTGDVTLAGTQTLTNKTINISNNTLTGVAPLASPTFTGTPAAPTAAAGANTTQLATTAHVFAERANTATLSNKTAISFASQFDAGNSGTTITLDFANGQKQLLTLTGNCTVTLSFPGVGNYQVLLSQDGVGGRTVTWAGVTRYVGSATAPDINTAISASTVVSIYYDGTNAWLGASKVNAA